MENAQFQVNQACSDILCSDKRREMLQSICRVGCYPVIFGGGQYQFLQVDLHELLVLKKDTLTIFPHTAITLRSQIKEFE